jgi:putative solute:sodium symporter small subunit
MIEQQNRQAYWKANLKLVALCLSIWFVVSYLFGIILVDQLNAISVGGYQLGFWFAQQGSIYVFVILIFFYAWRMNKLDRQFDVHED